MLLLLSLLSLEGCILLRQFALTGEAGSLLLLMMLLLLILIVVLSVVEPERRLARWRRGLQRRIGGERELL
jgi:hypothetical protein